MASDPKNQKKAQKFYEHEARRIQDEQRTLNTEPRDGDKISGYNVSGYNEDSNSSSDPVSGNDGFSNRPNYNQTAQVVNSAALSSQNKLDKFAKVRPEWVKQEAKIKIMQSLATNKGILPGVGKVEVGSDFFDYCVQKQEEQNLADWDRFMFAYVSQYLSKPEDRLMIEKNPYTRKYLKELKNGMRRKRREQALLEDIGLYGVQGDKDMRILYERQRELNPLIPSDAPEKFQSTVPRESTNETFLQRFISYIPGIGNYNVYQNDIYRNQPNVLDPAFRFQDLNIASKKEFPPLSEDYSYFNKR